VRLQFIGHFSNQLGGGKIRDHHGAVFTKRAGLRGCRIGFRKVLNGHEG